MNVTREMCVYYVIVASFLRLLSHELHFIYVMTSCTEIYLFSFRLEEMKLSLMENFYL